MVERVGQRALILLLERAEEEAPDARDVRRPGLGEACSALGRDHGIRAAPVGRAALASHESLALEPVDEPRHAAAREQRRIGQLAHAQVVVAVLREHQQHLVLGHCEPVCGLELGIELGQHACVSP